MTARQIRASLIDAIQTCNWILESEHLMTLHPLWCRIKQGQYRRYKNLIKHKTTKIPRK